MPVPCREAPVVSFLPQTSRFSIDFWAGWAAAARIGSPGRRRLPQICTGGWYPRHEELARIELSPVGWGACPIPELPMLSAYVPSESSLKKVTEADLAALPENAVWIDLVKPTAAEDKAVERLAGIAVPTREDMQEIEISSRPYIENGARYMTATLMGAADTPNPRTTPVTFILAMHRLVTVRYDEPKPFMLVENKLARACAPGITGEMVLMELLDAVIDRNADILERAGSHMDSISHDIFEPEGAARTGHAKRYSDILIAIGRKGDLTSKPRESLVSIGRVVTFVAAAVDGVKWSRDMCEQLKTL